MNFDAGKWHARVLFEPGNYHALSDYVTDGQSLDVHLQLSKYLNQDLVEREFGDLENNLQDMIKAAKSDSVDSALETLSRQMIVLSVTLTEGMIGEYAECLFYKFPQRAYQYVESGGMKGVVSMTDITTASSLTNLLEHISSMGARNLLKGKYSSVLKKLEDVSNNTIEDKLKTRLIEVVDLRNKIVHEAHSPSVSAMDVSSAFDDMYLFLAWICNCLENAGVPFNDPGGILKK